MMEWYGQGHLRPELRVSCTLLPSGLVRELDENQRAPDAFSHMSRGGEPWFVRLGALMDATRAGNGFKYVPLRIVSME